MKKLILRALRPADQGILAGKDLDFNAYHTIAPRMNKIKQTLAFKCIRT